MLIFMPLFSGIAKAECSVHVLAVKIMQIIFNQGSVGNVVSGKKAQSERGSEKWKVSLSGENEDKLTRHGGI